MLNFCIFSLFVPLICTQVFGHCMLLFFKAVKHFESPKAALWIPLTIITLPACFSSARSLLLRSSSCRFSFASWAMYLAAWWSFPRSSDTESDPDPAGPWPPFAWGSKPWPAERCCRLFSSSCSCCITSSCWRRRAMSLARHWLFAGEAGERETDRQREGQRQWQRDTVTETERKRARLRKRQWESKKEKEWNGDRKRVRERQRQRYNKRERETDRQTETEMETERWTDRDRIREIVC